MTDTPDTPEEEEEIELPITVDEVKRYLRINLDDTSEDDEINRCILAGINFLEFEIGRDILARSYIERYPCFQHRIKLTRSPLIGVASVEYYDSNNELTNMEDVFVGGLFGSGYVIFGDDLPDTYDRWDAVIITYVSGFQDIPIINQACIWMAAHFYLNREAEVIGTSSTPLKLGIQRIINKLKAGSYY